MPFVRRAVPFLALALLCSTGATAADKANLSAPQSVAALASGVEAPEAPTVVDNWGFEAGEGFSLGLLTGQVGWTTFVASATQPVVSNVNPATGSQHMRISEDPDIATGTMTGGFSPNRGPQPNLPSMMCVDIAISGAFGADYDVVPQAPSQGFLTARVKFSFLGDILILDDPGGGLNFIDTGVDWTPGPYSTLCILVNPLANTIEYYYGGIPIYSSAAGVFAGTQMEQVVLLSDNFQIGESGDFDNLLINTEATCTIVPPPDVVVGNDAGQCGAVVAYAAPGGTCTGVTCAPPSGSFFPVGTTTVTCTDPTGGVSETFDVTVNDTEAPVATAPDLSVGTDPGVCQAVVAFTPGYSDNCPGGGTVCAPPSGSTFPLGDTVVNCTATDAAGNVGADAGNVNVFDDEPPALVCPADLFEVAPPGALSWPVSYVDPTPTDNCPGATASCAPPSGDPFPIGTSTVVCTAVDGASNATTCDFDVTVTTQAIQEIPTLGGAALALLALVLLTTGTLLLRRRRA